MYESKFIKLFLQLNRKEKQNLKLWVKSPFANAREDVTRLFNYIFSLRTLHEKNVFRRTIFKAVYPEQLYNEQQLRYLMSFASSCMEDFLSYYEWKNDPVARQLQFIKNINHKNVNTYTSQTIRETKIQLEQQNLRNSNYYWQLYQLETEQYVLQSKNKRFEDFHLQAIADNLHVYAITEILKQACAAISYEQVSGKASNFYLLDACVQLAEKQLLFRQTPTIHIYCLCYKLSTQGSDSLFQELYDLIFKHERCFSVLEIKDIFLLIINYCIKEMNIGKQAYAQYAYHLYIHCLRKEYLLDNGELSRFTFKNIVFIGTKKLKEFKRVENFITQYQHMINEQYRENTVLFNKATLYIAKKQYKYAMPILQKVEFEDVLWNLDAKSMLLRIHLEEKEYESFLSLVKSFKLYLHRQKNLGIYKTRYQNFIAFCEKLYTYRLLSKSKKTSLKSKIQMHLNLPEKEWFLEQAEIL